ncbi:hypothetical protein Cfor_03996, partial [Coptotermes formosanus]
TCFYEVVCFSDTFCTTNISIKLREKFEHIWYYKEFGTKYTIAIMGKNKDHTRESNKEWVNFTTPDCFYFYPNDLTKCVPPKPENVSVQVKTVGLSKHNLTVSWAKPVLQPAHFGIEVFEGPS